MNHDYLTPNNILMNLHWKNLDNQNMLEADIATVKAQLIAAAKIEGSYNATVVVINQNGDLSAQGRASALVATSKHALSELDKFAGQALAALDARIIDHDRVLRKAATGPDATAVLELRVIEARAAFAKIDPLLLPAAYKNLCADGTDDDACIAVENACGFAPLLKPEEIELGRAVRGARALPDQAEAMKSAADVRAILTQAVASVRRNVSTGAVASMDVLPLTPVPTGTDVEDE